MKLCQDIGWNDVYSIGDEAIDTEHKKIFTLANKVKSCSAEEEIKKAVKEVINYTKFHFASEERYMQEIDYPEFASHKMIHRELIEDLSNFLRQLNELSNQQIVDGLSSFINDQIINHILIEDKKVQHSQKNASQLREIFRWKMLYSIGHASIDEDHKKLFALAIKTLNYNQNGHVKLHVKESIKELYEYMKVHFENEERFMEEIKYDLIDHHKELHQKIIQQMHQFIKSIASMNTATFERKLIEYMDIWLVNHIVRDDKRISCFMQKKKYIS